MPLVSAGILEECNKEVCWIEPKKGGLFTTAAIECKYTLFGWLWLVAGADLL